MIAIKIFGELNPGDYVFIYHVDKCSRSYDIHDRLLVESVDTSGLIRFKNASFYDQFFNKDAFIDIPKDESRRSYVLSTVEDLDNLIYYAFHAGCNNLRHEIKSLLYIDI